MPFHSLLSEQLRAQLSGSVDSFTFFIFLEAGMLWSSTVSVQLQTFLVSWQSNMTGLILSPEMFLTSEQLRRFKAAFIYIAYILSKKKYTSELLSS